MPLPDRVDEDIDYVLEDVQTSDIAKFEQLYTERKGKRTASRKKGIRKEGVRCMKLRPGLKLVLLVIFSL